MARLVDLTVRHTIMLSFLLHDSRIDDRLLTHLRTCLEPLGVTRKTTGQDGGMRVEARLGIFTLLPSQGIATLALDETRLERLRHELEPIALDPPRLLASLAIVLDAQALGALDADPVEMLAALRSSRLDALTDRAIFAANAARLQAELVWLGADDGGTFASLPPI